MDTTISHASEFETVDFFDVLVEIISAGIELLATTLFNALEQIAHITNVIQNVYYPSARIPVVITSLSWDEAEQLGERHGLSKFETLAGYLLNGARAIRGYRLAASDYARIALRLDEEGLRPVQCLEGIARKRLANNNRDARKAIHTFGEALASEDFRRGTLRSLYRAHYLWQEILYLSASRQ